MIQDPGSKFEEIIMKFFGRPKTSIYFASYFDRTSKFERRALLFAICVKEININQDHYSKENIKKFEEFETKLSGDDVEYKTLIDCIKFLDQIEIPQS